MTEAEKKQEGIEEVELDQKALDTIVDKTKGALLPEMKTMIEAAAAESNKSMQEVIESVLQKRDEAAEEADKEKLAAAKGAEGQEEDASDPVARGIANGTIDPEIAKMSGPMRFMTQMKLLVNHDMEELKKYNAYNLATQSKARAAAQAKGSAEVAKTGYANETTDADGAVLIPDAEFVTTVYDNLPNYGVAFSDADVRQTDRRSVRVISLDSGLTFYSTAEAGVKTSAKLAFAKNEVSLQKYAVIVPATDEFTDDSAVDYWNLVTRELTRAYAKRADEIVFTDAVGSASGSGGITNQTGVLTHTLGAAGVANLDWNDLLVAQSKTEDDLDESNNKWYMRKETWYALIQKRADAVSASDGAGVYIASSLNTGFTPNPNNPTTPWGTPVKFTRVLPTINSVSANDAIAVYGDLRNYLLYNKRGMAVVMLTEASIVDADDTTTNLATQDITAMRAVVRLLGILPKGNRTKFVVLGSGTVS